MDVCVCIHTKSEFVKQDRLQRLTKKNYSRSESSKSGGKYVSLFYLGNQINSKVKQ